MNDWSHDAVFYHIYPLGLCGAPQRNDPLGAPVPRLAELHGWIDHLRTLGVNALYLGPLFESSAHGYDTADYTQVDRRLGDNSTLVALSTALHAAGIRLILDGVFNHVGRDFPAFRELQAQGADSPYRDWFVGIDFNRRSPYGDRFSYSGWSGNYDLVKLNLRHPAVREHLFAAVRQWFEQFQIDGLRLDVAEDIDPTFLRDLAALCQRLHPGAWLMGEQVHGDYRRLTQGAALHSATNYELFKGLYSSLNDRNYFEVAFTLNRQFGAAGIYRGLPLYNFADNHDVTRIASRLHDPRHLLPLYALLLTIPGVPSIYYGSEWGIGGQKGGPDDWPLRPRLTLPQPPEPPAQPPELPAQIARLIRLRQTLPALRRGDYTQLYVSNQQFAFARRIGGQTAVVALNAASSAVQLTLPLGRPDARVLSDALQPAASVSVQGGRISIEVPAFGVRVLDN